jgi:hypothetical protein
MLNPSHPHWIESPNSTQVNSIMQFSPVFSKSLSVTLNILQVHPFSNIISVRPTLHPHKTTRKIIVVCLLIFTFLETGLCKCRTFTTRLSGAENEFLRIRWKVLKNVIWNMSGSVKDPRYKVKVPNTGIQHDVFGLRVSALWKWFNGVVRPGTTMHD